MLFKLYIHVRFHIFVKFGYLSDRILENRAHSTYDMIS